MRVAALQPGVQVHFRCGFEVSPAEGESEEAWSRLLKTIRKWVAESPAGGPPDTDEEFGRRWFFAGGSWGSEDGRYRVVTKRLDGEGTDQEPQFWAMRYEHWSREVPGRAWRTDVGVTRTGDASYCFCMTVGHYQRRGFFGEVPEPPSPSSPRLVKTLVSSPHWHCRAGKSEMSVHPTVLDVGDGLALESVLTDASRRSPVIVVGCDSDTGAFLFDSQTLARNLVGAASVFQFGSLEAADDVNRRLTADFACRTIRVYLPPVEFGRPSQGRRRHRYIPHERIVEDADGVMRSLLLGVMHWDTQVTDGAVGTIDDVERLRTSSRLEEYKRGNMTRHELDELLAEVAEENDGFRKDNAELRAENTELLRELELTMDDLQELKASSERNAAEYEYRLQGAEERASNAESQTRASAALVNEVCMLDLPRTKRDVLELASRLFPDRIGFTSRALTTADEARAPKEAIWEAVRSMAVHLHPMLFSDESVEVRTAFPQVCGFDIAMTERALTRENTTMMAERNDMFEDKAICCEPHVKVDGNTTRLYFDKVPHEGRNLIVISKVGHLTTAGTRRL